MLILVGFARKSELWQQVMPISHRSCQIMVAISGVLFGTFNLWFLQQIMAIAMPTTQVRSMCKSTDFDAVMYSAWFPMPTEHLTRAANVPNAQSRGDVGTYVHFSLVYATPCAPKSKWHVLPPSYGFAYGSCSQLFQSLCPPNGSKPKDRTTLLCRGMRKMWSVVLIWLARPKIQGWMGTQTRFFTFNTSS